jgi:hypothetical protein
MKTVHASLIMVLALFLFVTDGRADTKAKDKEDKELLGDFFDRAEIAEPVVVGNLKVFPIVRKEKQDGDQRSYHVTDEAMKSKVIHVKEHQGGQVNTLKLEKKKSGKQVFMMGGEILSGAKQDRILSQDVLLPQKKGSYLLSVYCVEAGRWVLKTDQFQTKGIMGTSKLRKTVAKKESQSNVWGEVSKKSGAMNVDSPTSNMTANYDDPKIKKKIKNLGKKLDDGIEALQEKHELIGLVATVKGEIISLDAFRNEELFSGLWHKIAKSMALDAIDPSFKEGEVTKEDVALFIESLDDAKIKTVENPGMGREIAIESSWAAGTAHLSDGVVNHVNLFPEYGELKMRVLTDKVAGSSPAVGGFSGNENAIQVDNPVMQPQQVSPPSSAGMKKQGKQNKKSAGKDQP